MPILRLTQTVTRPDAYRIEFALEGDGPRLTAGADFEYALSRRAHEQIRWYIEEYAKDSFNPDTRLAREVERQLGVIGTVFFRTVFEANRDTQRLWDRILDRLQDVRLEIETTVQDATALPWELLRDPTTDVPLALRAEAFVRVQQQTALKPNLPRPSESADAPIRVLLVICRPDQGDDVPFRSVASRLVKLTADRSEFALSVLRPPTWAELGRVVRAAKQRGEPFHVVHFDGHGIYQERDQIRTAFGTHQYSDQRPGKHGYLAFEHPGKPGNLEPVSGTMIGSLLREADVPVLLLNACRSAHAESAAADETSPPEPAVAPPAATPHEHVRAFGSLAQEVMDAGVAGVLAMRYNVYVVTAVQYVAELYRELVQGCTLGAAATRARKYLADQPQREINGRSLELQDWLVPVIYEAAPIQLFARKAAGPLLTLSGQNIDAAATPAAGGLLPATLPAAPDVGFIGRDETLLALDRACDEHAIVLLHALAGNGKTTAAAEFARWYALTGGTDVVLWTSFEGSPKTLDSVLGAVESAFAATFQHSGIEWLSLSAAARRQLTLDIFRQVRVLWIWDNVEPIAGFPDGAISAWSAAEQRELADFLRAARETKARFVLTSRRDERAWLGELPRRIIMPRMRLADRVAMLRAMANNHGVRVFDPAPWRPLLDYSLGNPLTLTVLIGQALRQGLHEGALAEKKLKKFVEQLRQGEAQLDDDESQGRAKSLSASLNYGFSESFSEDERRQLALLHLFQGFVDVKALLLMGNANAEWGLPALHGLTRESGIALLDRAAAVGLLTSHGDGYYAMHPALPWYFKSMFERYWGSLEGDSENPQQDKSSAPAGNPRRAFVEAMGGLGDFYHNQYINGNTGVIGVLQVEESNLLYARHMAIAYCWHSSITSTMQGLRNLYEQTGRYGAWVHLVNEIVPLFVDPATDGPLPGREDQWSMVTHYRVHLAQEARAWSEAERLQKAQVAWSRAQSAAMLEIEPEALDALQRHMLRTLAVVLLQLAQIQMKLVQPECVTSIEEVLLIVRRIGDRAMEDVAAFNLGHAYKDISAIKDLNKAEQWYSRSLELTHQNDEFGQAKCFGQLGLVAYERFRELRQTEQPDHNELLKYLNSALKYYYQALELTPANAPNELATSHNQLGSIYNAVGDFDRALQNYRAAVRYFELASNIYGAGTTRRNIASTFAQHRRFTEALLYAEEALRNLESCGSGAASDVKITKQLIAYILAAMQGT
jgi:tetratricopeptide (TPR) repeat protein